MDFISIIGLIAATLTTIAFLPQAIKIIKTKSTKDISLITFLVTTIGVFMWLIYGLLITDLPLILANFITFIIMSTILILKIKYR